MDVKRATLLFTGYTETQLIQNLKVALEEDRPQIKETADGNQKILVRGWSIVLFVKEDGILAEIKPDWVRDKKKSMINLEIILTCIFSFDQ